MTKQVSHSSAVNLSSPTPYSSTFDAPVRIKTQNTAFQTKDRPKNLDQLTSIPKHFSNLTSLRQRNMGWGMWDPTLHGHLKALFLAWSLEATTHSQLTVQRNPDEGLSLECLDWGLLMVLFSKGLSSQLLWVLQYSVSPLKQFRKIISGLLWQFSQLYSVGTTRWICIKNKY